MDLFVCLNAQLHFTMRAFLRDEVSFFSLESLDRTTLHRNCSPQYQRLSGA